jgi:ketosteroid isomerase-like protein
MAPQPPPPRSSALELTRRSFESANGGDYDAMMPFFGPDFVWDVSPWGLGTHTGVAAIRAFFVDWIGAFEDYEVVLEELLEVGAGVVLAIAHQSGRPTGSRGRLHLQHAAVFVWVDGVAVLVTNYRDLEQARAAGAQAAVLAS